MRWWMIPPMVGALVGSVACTGDGSATSAGERAGDGPGEPEQRSAGQPEVLATDLDLPWDVDFLPDGAAVVVERDTARLLRVDPDGSTTELTSVPAARDDDAAGLLGLAVSPEFVSDGMLYLYHGTDTDDRVVRLSYEPAEVEDGAPIVGEPEVVLSGIPQASEHNGGRLVFGPEGMLYVGTGDAGEPELAQDTDSLAGKVLRITPEGEPAEGNPFDNHVYTYGHQDVQGLAWADGSLYAVESGVDAAAEINALDLGENYGWPEVTGVAGEEEFTDPVAVWAEPEETPPGGAAVAGGSVWAPGARDGRLWQFPLSSDAADPTPVPHLPAGEHGRLRAVTPTPEQDALWVTTSNRDNDPGADDDLILRVPLD